MVAYAFGDVLVDAAARRVTRNGTAVEVPERHFDVLVALLARAGEVVPKQALIDAGWKDLAVTDNSLEQAISGLRRALGEDADGRPLIQTVARQGYRFTAAVEKKTARASDTDLDALLQPHRAWIEGRAALETLERDRIGRARLAFEQVLQAAPEQATAHVGLANARVMQFEMTRADDRPDIPSLEAAARHAREACRLAPESGEAWATLGFVLDRTGHHDDALAASRRAVMLEPDNWRHHFRLAYIGWGEERLRASHRTAALLPGFPLAHWLAATVHVARQSFDEAERQLGLGLAHHETTGAADTRFSAVALHWLHGLVRASRGDPRAAREAFEREIGLEASGHLYARECGAQARYALGALAWHAGDRGLAAAAFRETIERVPGHVWARAALAATASDARATEPSPESAPSVDAALAHGVGLVASGRPDAAPAIVERALATARPGAAGWLLPVEPMLRVWTQPGIWGPALARLRARAA